MRESSQERQTQSYGWVLIVAVVLLIGVVVYTAQAESPYGLVKNGGFEEGFRGWGPNDSQIPNGWEPFVIQDPKAPPQFKDSAAFGGFTERLDGDHCLIIWSHWVPFDAGIFQTVANVSPGTSYQFKIDWAPMQSYNPEKGGKLKGDFLGRVVGIDPTGGTDPQSPNVVWSPELWKAKRASGDTLRVSAAAKSSTITVFIRAKNPQPHGQDQVFIDVASLNVDPSQPAQPPPSDTPAPATNTPVRAAAAPTRVRVPPTATAAQATATPLPTATDTATPGPTDTPAPTDTATPVPPTPTPTRTPKPTATPASWLDSPPPTLTGVLLVLGIGSEGIALSLAGILGWVWYRGKRRPRQAAVEEYRDYHEEPQYPDFRDAAQYRDEPETEQHNEGREDDFSSWD